MVVHLEHLMPVAEAACKAGISRERLVRMIQCGRVRGQRIGGRWFTERAPVSEMTMGSSPGASSGGSQESGPELSVGE